MDVLKAIAEELKENGYNVEMVGKRRIYIDNPNTRYYYDFIHLKDSSLFLSWCRGTQTQCIEFDLNDPNIDIIDEIIKVLNAMSFIEEITKAKE